MRLFRKILLPLAFAFPVQAQVPDSVEAVTVTALWEKQIQAYVDNHVAPSARLGKVGRWEAAICPTATGLKEDLLEYVVARVKAVAERVHAPVSQNRHCRHNVEVVFSSKPQSVMNYVRDDMEAYLGTHDNKAQAEEMARVKRPIQAWYATGTIDSNGEVFADRPKKGPPECFDQPKCSIWISADMPKATGSRLGNGLRTGFRNVIVMVERDKLKEQEIGSISDYIAFLILSEPLALDDCTVLPSILNLLAPNCSSNAADLSPADLAYLNALYTMRADLELRGQKDQIAYHMKQALGTSK